MLALSQKECIVTEAESCDFLKIAITNICIVLAMTKTPQISEHMRDDPLAEVTRPLEMQTKNSYRIMRTPTQS